MDKKPFWLSSANPQQLSLTIRGILTAVIPLALTIARVKGITFTDDQVGEFTDALEKLLIAFTGFISAAQIVIGIGRKIYYSIFPKPQY